LTETHQGLLFVLIGPPGAGKNALMNDALARATNGNLRQLATATTRPMRPTEQQGREHLFLDIPTFQTMIEQGELLEWQQVHGNLYGIPRQTLESAFAAGQDLTADIDVLGATYIRSLYPDNVILIFVKPPSLAELETRMRTRGESETDIATRMRRVAMEMTYEPVCDHVIVNDDLQHAAEQLDHIILTERQRQTDNQSAGLSRRLTYRVTAIALYQDEVLRHDKAPHYPEDQPHQDELPHQTTLRLMHEVFGVENPLPDHLFEASPHEGSFIPPVMIEGDAEAREIHFTYLYLLNQRIAQPDGWRWTRVADADLPQAIVEVLFRQVSA
jgi:guanylate kinase